MILFLVSKSLHITTPGGCSLAVALNFGIKTGSIHQEITIGLPRTVELCPVATKPYSSIECCLHTDATVCR
jgi:hypothetical protein